MFVIMFLPKSRQLSAVGKEGIYLEDQEHGRFSMHSDSDKCNSPSFYHFKPNKTRCFFQVLASWHAAR